MKISTISAVALLAGLAATSAYAAGKDDHSNATTAAQVIDFTATGSLASAPSGYAVTYPTNADSILKVAPDQRSIAGHHSSN